jgi:hypothetical protein
MKLLKTFALPAVLALCGLLVPQMAAAQTHSDTLIWQDGVNPVGQTTYNVYRLSVACPTSPAFAKPALVTGLAVLTDIDTAVTSGSYCYAVTAVVNAVESGYSNAVTANVPFPAPVAPTNLTVTPK